MEKVNALVLKSTEYKENDRILTLFTLERGIICANIRGVKKADAKLKFAAQPFCFAEYVLAEKSGRFTVTQASLHDSFYELSFDLTAYYAAYAMLEYVCAFLPEGEADGELFDLTVNGLKTLCYFGGDKRVVLAKYLLDALSLSGFGFNPEQCRECGNEISGKVYLDGKSGCCLCGDCAKAGDIEFNISTYEFIKKVYLKTAENITELKGELGTVKKTLKLLSYYIKLNTDVNFTALETLISSQI